MVLSCLPGASQAVQLVLSCLPGAAQAVQFVFSCLPGASQAVQLVLSCLPGASQAVQLILPASLVPPRVEKARRMVGQVSGTGVRPASLVPPWCLAGCPTSPVLPPWCLQAVQLVPGLSHGLSMIPGCGLFGLLAPPGLSKWSFNGTWLSPGHARSNLALADYWSQLALPWWITGVIRSWEFRAEP